MEDWTALGTIAGTMPGAHTAVKAPKELNKSQSLLTVLSIRASISHEHIGSFCWGPYPLILEAPYGFGEISPELSQDIIAARLSRKSSPRVVPASWGLLQYASDLSGYIISTLLTIRPFSENLMQPRYKREPLMSLHACRNSGQRGN